MADVVLAISNKMLVFDFSEAFVGAFDVGDKLTEVLMQRQGIDVCCTGGGEMIARFAASQPT
jgi:hypothetical protein